MKKYSVEEQVEHYGSQEEFIQKNPHSTPLARALVGYLIETGKKDILVFRGDNSPFYKRIKKTVEVFCRKAELAHRSTAKSSLLFKLAS